MVEIVLAVVILVSALTVVMALFPIGMQTNRRALSRADAAAAAEQVLGLLAEDLRRNPAFLAAVPPKKWTEPDLNLTWSKQSLLPGSRLLLQFPAPTTSFAPSTHGTGVFRVVHGSNVGPPMFTGIVRVWHTKPAASPGNVKTLTLHAEISWPAARPYAGRQSAVYSLGTHYDRTPDPAD